MNRPAAPQVSYYLVQVGADQVPLGSMPLHLAMPNPPRPVNHVLHAALTFLTCGLWAPVWVIKAAIAANR
jgi:hypothetical protein